MTSRELDDKVLVSPQITSEDLADLRASGVTAIICNRPDAEVMPDLSSAVIEQAANDIGMGFSDIPLAPGMLTLEIISAHLAALDAAEGRVLAYCASGTRSAYLWAFAMALGDRLPNEEILQALDKAGYPSPGLGPQLDHVRGTKT